MSQDFSEQLCFGKKDLALPCLFLGADLVGFKKKPSLNPKTLNPKPSTFCTLGGSSHNLTASSFPMFLNVSRVPISNYVLFL